VPELHGENVELQLINGAIAGSALARCASLCLLDGN
jgi:hypothetical protein